MFYAAGLRQKPDAVYDVASDRIIFQSVKRMYIMFPGFEKLLEAGRKQAIRQLLDTGIVRLSGKLTEDKISKSNLRHFSSSADIITAFSEDEKPG